MTKTSIRHPAAVDASARPELVREFKRRLATIHKQAPWLDMGNVAHFIGVAGLGGSEAEPFQRPDRDTPVNWVAGVRYP